MNQYKYFILEESQYELHHTHEYKYHENILKTYTIIDYVMLTKPV